MFIIYLLMMFGAGIAFIFLKKEQDKVRKIPDLKSVKNAISRFETRFNLSITLSEDEIENSLAKFLRIHFAGVRRQFPIASEAHRDRIDIDLGNGQFGIEIKLASLLKKSNERNRLLGQIDTYQTRKYGKYNLLVLIAGEKNWIKSNNAQEIKKMIENKNIGFYYLNLKNKED